MVLDTWRGSHVGRWQMALTSIDEQNCTSSRLGAASGTNDF